MYIDNARPDSLWCYGVSTALPHRTSLVPSLASTPTPSMLHAEEREGLGGEITRVLLRNHFVHKR